MNFNRFFFMFTLALSGCVGTTLSLGQESWPRFRGADATGVVEDDSRLPMTWSESDNVVWKTAIPGRGWGSPVIWGNQLFVSAVTNDEDYESPQAGLYLGRGRSEPPDTVHHWIVMGIDLTSGDKLWEHEAHVGKPVVPRHPKSTYAAETPVTDGERLYVLFGDLGLYCYSLDGTPLWSREIEPMETMWGYGAAASPVVVEGMVVVQYDNQESSYLEAFDCVSGETRWRQQREETSTWATPFVWEHEGSVEIVTAGKREIRSYSPQGELLWHFDGRMSDLTIPSPFASDGLLYLTSGYFQDRKRPVFAVRPGARGDITLEPEATSNEFIAWSLQEMGPYNTSPIVYRGRYYTLLDRGMITCHDSATGDLVFDRTRFPQQASFTASPWAYNGHLFFLAEDGTTYVMPHGDEFTVTHINELDELCIATPAISQGRLFIRTISSIYCLSNQRD